jgi:hypothetical protein
MVEGEPKISAESIVLAMVVICFWEFGVSTPTSNLNSDFTPSFLTL